MAMSRKHYQKFADILAGDAALAFDTGDSSKVRIVQNIMRSMGDVFAQDNTNFNRDKFYTACGFSDDGFNYPAGK